jgi:2,3-bisphosphoglycerate-independent phosphoglycerate mutase
MKYLVLVASGLATTGHEQDDPSTPLADAATPNLDRIAQTGRQGTCVLTERTGAAGLHAAARAILGVRPTDATLAAGPAYAAAHRVPLRPEAWTFCASFITCDDDGILIDATPDDVGLPEAQRLLSDLKTRANQELGAIVAGLRFIPGDGTTNVIVDDADHTYEKLVTHDPAAARGRRLTDVYPRGGSDEAVPIALVNVSAEMLADHEINEARRAAGDPVITHLWPWGPGRTRGGRTFLDRFGCTGAVVASSPWWRGLGSLLAMTVHEVRAARVDNPASRYDTIVRRVVSAFDEADVLVVEAPVVSNGPDLPDPEQHTLAVENYDRKLVGPILAHIERQERYRIMVLPDRLMPVDDASTPSATVPFAMAGTRITSVLQKPFTEHNASCSDLHIRRGTDLLEYFLFGGGMRARER